MIRVSLCSVKDERFIQVLPVLNALHLVPVENRFGSQEVMMTEVEFELFKSLTRIDVETRFDEQLNVDVNMLGYGATYMGSCYYSEEEYQNFLEQTKDAW